MKIKVYRTEAADNLAETIQTNNSVAYCVQAQLTQDKISDKVWEKIKTYASAKSNFDEDIFYQTKSILASTVWNKNDDIFGISQMWNARHSPVHTFTDIDHDHTQIVGCITDTWVIDAEGNLIADDTDILELPDKIHLCNSAVIWKYYKDENMCSRAETLISQIEDGKKFVSMECLFTDFDYGVISPENKYYVVARNEETSFLTKHLRMYGGQGSYDGYKIGRFLKNMVFSGKGYVDKPANPESIIFNDENELTFAQANHKTEWFNTESKKVENIVMANEIDYKAELDATKAKLAEAEKQVSQANIKAFEDQIKELREESVAHQEENKTLVDETKSTKAKLAETEATVKSLTDKIAELTASNEELAKTVKTAEAEKITSSRVTLLVEGGLSKEDAQAKVTKYGNLSDEQFADIAEDVIAAFNFDKEKKNKKDEKPADDKKKAEAEAETVLDNVVPNAGDAVGGVDTSDEVAATEKLKLSVASIFAGSMGINLDNSGEK